MPKPEVPLSSDEHAPADVELTDPDLGHDHVLGDSLKNVDKYLTEMHEEEAEVAGANEDDAGAQLVSIIPDDPIDDTINEPDTEQVDLPDPTPEPGDDDG